MALSSEAERKANYLRKRREQEKEELEEKRRKVEEKAQLNNITEKFADHSSTDAFTVKTVGLITLEEMKERQEQHRLLLAKAKAAEDAAQAKKDAAAEAEKKTKKTVLSFNFDDDEQDDDENEEGEDVKDSDMADEHEEKGVNKWKRRLGKNPDVDTSFLPDREREELERKEREKLCKEWVTVQDKMKKEEIEIVYSYWDGSGHRRSQRMRKGDTIQQFLQKCAENLRPDFPDLKGVSCDQLMFIKEDIILPHHYRFYDFIVSKAMGKTGPLFNFSSTDVMLKVALDDQMQSHAGKVCTRQWYEKNKHIFPACRWEAYDSRKQFQTAAVY